MIRTLPQSYLLIASFSIPPKISIPPEHTEGVTQALLDTQPTQLAGLAARDSLRLEAGMCLYGHDLDESTSPIEGALAWLVSKDRRQRADFPGAERILAELSKDKGPKRRRVGLVIDGAPARGTWTTCCASISSLEAYE